MNNNEQTLFNTISWILKRDYKLDFKSILASAKKHIEEEYEYYKSDRFPISTKHQFTRQYIINLINEYIGK